MECEIDDRQYTNPRGLFIVLEGGEGCGKTTQIRLINQWLHQKGYYAVVTKEPGDSNVGGKIREILLDPDTLISPEAETLLYLADRAEHVKRVIKPALSAGRIVLCDRYHMSTMAYQCAGRGVNPMWVNAVFNMFCERINPDLTLWINVPVERALQRISDKNPDRIERLDIEFHKKVHRHFAAETANPLNRNVIEINGDQDESEVGMEIVHAVRETVTLWSAPVIRKRDSQYI